MFVCIMNIFINPFKMIIDGFEKFLVPLIMSYE